MKNMILLDIDIEDSLSILYARRAAGQLLCQLPKSTKLEDIGDLDSLLEVLKIGVLSSSHSPNFKERLSKVLIGILQQVGQFLKLL